MKAVSQKRILVARIIAVVADGLQIGFFPLFAEGVASVLDVIVDVVVCAILVLLVGWHIAFLPSFVVKGLPILDEAPMWTIAILIATRKKGGKQEPPVIDVEVKKL